MLAAALLLSLLVCSLSFGQKTPDSLRIATYNLRNYLLMERLVEGDFRMDYPKPEVEKSVVRQTIVAAAPDLIALQEIGSEAMLLELRDDLAEEGLRYDGYCILEAEDETRRIGALWKGKLQVEPLSHIDMDYSFFGSRGKIARGLLELEVKDSSDLQFSVFIVHLKSKYTIDDRDQQSALQRTKEAEVARDRILERFPNPAESRFMVVGDFNDYRNSAPVRRFLSRGDKDISRIIEAQDERGLIWTHFYAKGGEYALIDYILCSPAIGDDAVLGSGILSNPDFYAGSDHRLVWVDIKTAQIVLSSE